VDVNIQNIGRIEEMNKKYKIGDIVYIDKPSLLNKMEKSWFIIIGVIRYNEEQPEYSKYRGIFLNDLPLVHEINQYQISNETAYVHMDVNDASDITIVHRLF